MTVLDSICRYLWNVIVALSWALLLLAGALAGVDRKRTVKLIRGRRMTRTAVAVPRSHAPRPEWQTDLEQALDGLAANRRQIQCAVGKARAASASSFTEAFQIAMASLRPERTVQ